jgi:multidrug efflux pump subunit AcrA (membrane-fusion protein)
VVQTLLPLAKSAIAIGEPLWFPIAAEELPPQLAEQLQDFLDESHARGLGLVPLYCGGADEGELVGLLCLERFGRDFDEPSRERSAPVAQAAAAALANAIEYERIPFRSGLQWAAAVLGIGPGRRWSPALVAAGMFVVVFVALWLMPAELTIEARGQLLPQRRQHVFAPSDSTVIDLPLTDGAKVAKGDLLARLHSPQLDIAESELLGKVRTAQEDLLSAETESLRSERDGGTTQPRSQLTSRVQQLKEEIRGLEAQLQIVRQQQAQLAIKSPLTGVVITWDAERQLAGRPVKRGDSLLTVADLAGPWEMVLDVPDRRAGHVLKARRDRADLPITFQLGTDPGAVRHGTVTFVAPATELSPQTEPSVRVTANLADTPPAQLRPGATVVARIHCGRSSLGYVWLHELWEAVWLRLFL